MLLCIKACSKTGKLVKLTANFWNLMECLLPNIPALVKGNRLGQQWHEGLKKILQPSKMITFSKPHTVLDAVCQPK